ncbi:MAG: RCC1 domain-containing protein, partial [Acidimicrobiaceae bacterium]|nr:RCC1 domain-containing protein [Acidimicrobiaceae bacterium]
DDTITCWGDNDDGQADPPTGTFKAVTAGWSHSCGLRTDDTITCWGDNDDGQADPPTGNFKAVTAGGFHSCGLRTDDTITCWGDNDDGQADPSTAGTTTTTVPPAGSQALRVEVTECTANIFFEGYMVTIRGIVYANRAVSGVTVSRFQRDPSWGYAQQFGWTRDELGSLSAGQSKSFRISSGYNIPIYEPSDSDCHVWVNFGERD